MSVFVNAPAFVRPTPPSALLLSRRIWNLRARQDRGEDVGAELKAALADLAAYRCRDV